MWCFQHCNTLAIICSNINNADSREKGSSKIITLPWSISQLRKQFNPLCNALQLLNAKDVKVYPLSGIFSIIKLSLPSAPRTPSTESPKDPQRATCSLIQLQCSALVKLEKISEWGMLARVQEQVSIWDQANRKEPVLQLVVGYIDKFNNTRVTPHKDWYDFRPHSNILMQHFLSMELCTSNYTSFVTGVGHINIFVLIDSLIMASAAFLFLGVVK